MILVKIGGRFAENDALVAALADELAALQVRGQKSILVHGGGVTVSELQKLYGIEPRFIDGLRQTKPEEMPLVDMALAGAVNKRLVRIFRSRGVNAWGLSGTDGATISGRSVAGDPVLNRTGAVTDVSTRCIRLMWAEDFYPILAPPSIDADGLALNINADEAALAIAEALEVERLVFLSDVPGVLKGGNIIAELNTGEIEALIADATIGGGMIPKVRSAAGALESGVGAVYIGTYGQSGDLDRILSENAGTKIYREL